LVLALQIIEHNKVTFAININDVEIVERVKRKLLALHRDHQYKIHRKIDSDGTIQ